MTCVKQREKPAFRDTAPSVEELRWQPTQLNTTNTIDTTLYHCAKALIIFSEIAHLISHSVRMTCMPLNKDVALPHFLH